MPGYMFVMGPCWACGRLFAYNPVHVPSVRVDKDGKPDPKGKREPVCGPCMFLVNERREGRGLEPHPIHPTAYEAEEA